MDFEKIIGMKFTEAAKAIQQEGFKVRITKQDGKNLIVTMDFDVNRINVAVDDDVVTKILGRG